MSFGITPLFPDQILIASGLFLVMLFIPLTSKYLSLDLTSHTYSGLIFWGMPLRNILNIDMCVFSQVKYLVPVIFITVSPFQPRNFIIYYFSSFYRRILSLHFTLMSLEMSMIVILVASFF